MWHNTITVDCCLNVTSCLRVTAVQYDWLSFAPTCGGSLLRHVHSHRGQGKVGEPSAVRLRHGGHAEAAVQLVPLQHLEARADPAVQPTEGHTSRRGQRGSRVDVRGKNGKKHKEPHDQTQLLFKLNCFSSINVQWFY